MSIPALVIADTEKSFFGLPSRLGEKLCGLSVLEFTLKRLASIQEIDRIYVLHPEGQKPGELVSGEVDADVEYVSHAYGYDAKLRTWQSGRKWAMTGWRGGLGWTSIYDEVLPAKPIAEVMGELGVDAAFFVRGDWVLFDKQSASEMIKTHMQAPDSFRFCFTQSPPGLSGFVASRTTFEQFEENGASFGKVLGYSHQQPMLDPISSDANIAISPSVRDCNRRFVYDTYRSKCLIDQLAEKMEEGLVDASAEEIAEAVYAYEAENPEYVYEMLPQQITIELTPNRKLDGPLTPQHYLSFEREAMDVESVKQLIDQIAADDADDVVITFAGMGDQLEYDAYGEMIRYADEAGVLGIALETDLLVEDDDQLCGLNDLPLDLLLVNLNADTAKTYEKVMGTVNYKLPLSNLEKLFNNRIARYKDGDGEWISWIIPEMMKTTLNLDDMETFFARWMTYAGHAIIKPFQTGLGLLPDLSPVPMQPPYRQICKQLGRRLSVLSDGSVLQCDQDIMGELPLGNADEVSLLELWGRQEDVYAKHRACDFSCEMCAGCGEWFRP
ncbi:SPASM domain-containing protein [Planctomycetota bacterium]|nr:SPASM domain-containing protein [Planctomycetota bacterium]